MWFPYSHNVSCESSVTWYTKKCSLLYSMWSGTGIVLYLLITDWMYGFTTYGIWWRFLLLCWLTIIASAFGIVVPCTFLSRLLVFGCWEASGWSLETSSFLFGGKALHQHNQQLSCSLGLLAVLLMRAHACFCVIFLQLQYTQNWV